MAAPKERTRALGTWDRLLYICWLTLSCWLGSAVSPRSDPSALVPQNKAQNSEAAASGEDIYIRGGQGPVESRSPLPPPPLLRLMLLTDVCRQSTRTFIQSCVGIKG